ncbi:hypothetical protein C8F01DRAFT_1312216 [Mycena amicta]|nr:hypothetical protein C8F01DRAFT_1312216 [Mycena amicta]
MNAHDLLPMPRNGLGLAHATAQSHANGGPSAQPTPTPNPAPLLFPSRTGFGMKHSESPNKSIVFSASPSDAKGTRTFDPSRVCLDGSRSTAPSTTRPPTAANAPSAFAGPNRETMHTTRPPRGPAGKETANTDLRLPPRGISASALERDPTGMDRNGTTVKPSPIAVELIRVHLRVREKGYRWRGFVSLFEQGFQADTADQRRERLVKLARGSVTVTVTQAGSANFAHAPCRPNGNSATWTSILTMVQALLNP